MRFQFVLVVLLFLAAAIAIPLCYSHRMNGGIFFGTLLAFTVTPLSVGLWEKQAYRSVTLVALALVLLCPVVFVITDPLAAEFEKVRDIYFLGTFSTVLLVSSTWYMTAYRTRKWFQYFAAILGGSSSALGVLVLLWMIMVFE